VKTLMKRMGIEALYRRPRTTKLSITHNLGGLGRPSISKNLESKESLVIPC
jgi:hypothetical protein